MAISEQDKAEMVQIGHDAAKEMFAQMCQNFGVSMSSVGIERADSGKKKISVKVYNLNSVKAANQALAVYKETLARLGFDAAIVNEISLKPITILDDSQVTEKILQKAFTPATPEAQKDDEEAFV
jgi:hypothetical protein